MPRKQKVLAIPIPPLAELPRVQAHSPSEYPYWEIWRLKYGVRCDHLIVCDSAVGCWTHYIKAAKRTTPCRKPFGIECPYCGTVDAKYAAYLAVQQTVMSTTTVLALPKMCVERYPWLTSRTDLFGLRLAGRKDFAGPKSPIKLELSEARETALHARAKVDWRWLQKVLLNIWGFVSLADGEQQYERGS